VREDRVRLVAQALTRKDFMKKGAGFSPARTKGKILVDRFLKLLKW
jgi:hypothetical protein